MGQLNWRFTLVWRVHADVETAFHVFTFVDLRKRLPLLLLNDGASQGRYIGVFFFSDLKHECVLL